VLDHIDTQPGCLHDITQDLHPNTSALGHSGLVLGPSSDQKSAVSKSDMPWFIPLCLCLVWLALVTGVFVASVRNARAIRQDLDKRFEAVQARLERDANAIADRLLDRTDEGVD